jgi:hypothetical protein
MAGFTRRYPYFPALDVITQIEGVVIVDLPPPGAITGVDTGVVGIVGEFPDVTTATGVDGNGNITSDPRPAQVVSSQDLIDQFGGFDPTLGDFGVSGGNGFVELYGKKYSGLVISAINIASAKGIRVVRSLPVSTSATDTTPVVPLVGGTVPAGTEFRNGSGRVRTAGAVNFTSNQPIAVGVGGSIANAGTPAATQPFTPDGANVWTTIARPDGTLGVKKGDIIVIGHNNAGALKPLPAGGNLGAGTYRVTADGGATPGATLTVERLDGANFDFVADTAVPWRIHFASDADSAPVIVYGVAVPGGYAFDDAGGYTVPARPITNSSGAQSDGSYSAAVVLTPAVTPPTITGSTWDPFSGLQAAVGPAGLTFTAAVQGINPAASASIDALYVTALGALNSDETPISSISIAFAARTSANIRTALKSHALDTSYRGRGRVVIVTPEVNVISEATVIGTASPGVGATRDERVVYSWPGERVFVSNAVNLRIKTALGTITTDGVLDVSFAGRMASLLSNLPPERNPGQSQAPVPSIMATCLGIQRGAQALRMEDYIRLKSAGVAALRIDKTMGAIVQSGITSSLVSGQSAISRRRMADYIQDAIAARLNQFSKSLLTQDLKDSAVAEVAAFLESLVSPTNRAAQRIDSYSIDEKSGNTPTTDAAGVFVIITNVKLTPTGDVFVLQTNIGPGVVTTSAA